MRRRGHGRRRWPIAAAHPPDLVILDLGLPDMDGVEVIEGLRGWTKAPIIVLSGRTDSSDKVEALDAGADDYVTKPFGMDELLARHARAVRRRRRSRRRAGGRLGAHRSTWRLAASPGWSRWPTRDDRRRPTCGSRPTEWHMLEILLRHPGKLVSQRQLLTEVWGPAYANESATCGCTWPSCAASSSRTRRGRAT